MSGCAHTHAPARTRGTLPGNTLPQITHTSILFLHTGVSGAPQCPPPATHTETYTHTPPPEHRINASQAATAARFSRFLEICLYCIFPGIFSNTRRTPQNRVKSSFLALRRLQKENHPPQAGGSKRKPPSPALLI